jgi:hypothetical protein
LRRLDTIVAFLIVSTTLSFVVHDVRCRVLSMLDDVVDVGRLCLLTGDIAAPLVFNV